MSLRRLVRRCVLLMLPSLALVFAAPAEAKLDFASVSAGLNHTCGVKADGTAWCWGEGRQGQVGVIGATREKTPIYVIGSYQTASISSGQSFWCELLREATVSCTGRADRGQIGNGKLMIAQFPQEVPLTDVTRVAAGTKTACAIYGADHGVACWGDGQRGQLGNGRLVEDPVATPQPVPNLSGMSDVSVADGSACGVRGDGAVLCWGDTEDAKLGYRNDAAIALPTTPVQGLTSAISVVAGDRFGCALRQDRTVWCWGNGDTGQLGQGTPTSSERAIPVPALTNVTQIAGAGLTMCAVKSDGSAVCWGDGSNGQIGNGQRANALSPQPVSDIHDAAQITMGSQHACLVTRGGTPYCWGRNSAGQLGTGGSFTQVALTPAAVQEFQFGPQAFVPAGRVALPAGSTAGGVLQFDELQLQRAGRLSCPSQATLSITALGRTAVRKAKVVRANNGCALSGQYLLPQNSQHATTARYRVKGTNLRTRTGSLQAERG